MHFVLIIVAVAAAILFDIRPSGAYQGPWCAVRAGGPGHSCTIAACEPSNSASRR